MVTQAVDTRQAQQVNLTLRNVAWSSKCALFCLCQDDKVTHIYVEKQCSISVTFGSGLYRDSQANPSISHHRLSNKIEMFWVVPYIKSPIVRCSVMVGPLLHANTLPGQLVHDGNARLGQGWLAQKIKVGVACQWAVPQPFPMLKTQSPASGIQTIADQLVQGLLCGALLPVPLQCLPHVGHSVPRLPSESSQNNGNSVKMVTQAVGRLNS